MFFTRRNRTFSIRPLTFRNPFSSTGFIPPPEIDLTSYIPTGFDNEEYTTSLGPMGVNNVEKRDKELDAIRRAQAANAKIYRNKKDRLFHDIAKAAKKRKRQLVQSRVIQYLAENAELLGDMDLVPESLISSVKSYQKSHRKRLNYIAAKKRADLLKKLKNRDYQLTDEEQSMVKHFDKTLGTVWRDEDKYTDDLTELYNEAQDEADAAEEGDDDDDETGSGIIEGRKLYDKVYGCRRPSYSYDENCGGILQPKAKRLHELVRPWMVTIPKIIPEEEVKTQQQRLEDRQNSYIQDQKENRGQEPPREMVKRAMPETAEPIADDAIPKPFKILHPPVKKYQFIHQKRFHGKQIPFGVHVLGMHK